jgi:hypothetical protein
MATLLFALGKRPATEVIISEEFISGADISMNKQSKYLLAILAAASKEAPA